MSDAADVTGPWYHYFWPWFVVVLLGSTVVAGLATLVIATRGADSLVVDDYYRDGKAINRSFAADREAALREVRARVEFAPRLTVHLEILGEAPAALELALSHATRAERDRVLRFEATSAGVYVADAPGGSGDGAPPDGRFYATLRPAGDPSPWRLRGRVELPAQPVVVLEPAG